MIFLPLLFSWRAFSLGQGVGYRKMNCSGIINQLLAKGSAASPCYVAWCTSITWPKHRSAWRVQPTGWSLDGNMFSHVRGDATSGHRYLQKKKINITAIQVPARHDTAFGYRLLPAWQVVVCSSQTSSHWYKKREANVSASQQAPANILDVSVGKAFSGNRSIQRRNAWIY